MKFFQEKSTLFYLLALTGSVSILAILYYNTQKIEESSSLVSHTQEVMHKSDMILLDIVNLETASRGYILVGNESFLESYHNSLSKIPTDLASFELIINDNPRQQIRFDSLKKTIARRLFLSRDLVKSQQVNELNEAEKKELVIKGQVLTDSIRNLIANINSDEFALLQKRKSITEQSSQNSQVLFLTLFCMILFIFILVYIIVKNNKIRNTELETFMDTQKVSSKYSLSLIEASLDPLVVINTRGKITDMNEATVNITGIDRDKLIGSDFFGYFTEHQKAREVYQEVFEKGSVADSPLTLRHKDGKLTAVLFNGSVYKDDNGKVLGVVIVARDIAEQKWALELRMANMELAFQNDEKEKRAAELDIANKELAFQNDEKEKRAAELVIANKELAFQNQVKEKRAAELAIANEELAFQNNEKESRAEELSIANVELAFQNNEKEKRAAELVIANEELIFQSLEKEKRAAELVIADIELDFQNTEKEKREIANKELEAFSNSLKLASQYSLSLIEASRDPLFTISIEGKITDTNQASVRVTGVSREQLIGSDFAKYFTEPEKAKEGYQQVFDKGFVVDYPLTITDGDSVDVLFNGSVYKDEQGKVIGAVVVARDITEKKRIENELVEAKVFAELATSIAEEQTQKAQEAVKAKQQFLSNMSHEIRTPMNAIIGFTKVVLKTNLTGKQKEYLNAIKMSGDALIVLINDILDLAKVDAGKMTFEKTAFKMSASISAMLHLFETKIQEKNLKLITNYDKNIPDVLIGDPVRLHQIILNLVSNAVKFTTVGKITVSVRLLEEDEDNVNIEFSINDTGIGIKADRIESVFENFQQATSNTSRLFGGTGLGLAIVKQLVEPQGGTIRVESVVNEGSTFSFTLPFKKTHLPPVPEADIIELNAAIKNIKVLVVEDMALNQLLMKTLLDDFGFESDIAANGRLAVEKLETNSYDIILMDLQMPVMNGFEATEYIRKTLKSDIPIIALTADVTTVDVAKCRAVGMNDYIAKPVDERLLFSKIIAYKKKPMIDNANFSEGKITPCINLAYLRQLTKSNPVLMAEMIAIYLEQTPPIIQAAKLAVKNEDWNLLQGSVHKMLPSFTIMGISSEYENIAKQIQEYPATGEFTDEVGNLVEQLENACSQTCKELTTELNLLKKYT